MPSGGLTVALFLPIFSETSSGLFKDFSYVFAQRIADSTELRKNRIPLLLFPGIASCSKVHFANSQDRIAPFQLAAILTSSMTHIRIVAAESINSLCRRTTLRLTMEPTPNSISPRDVPQGRCTSSQIYFD
jgi:hypothetical protein